MTGKPTYEELEKRIKELEQADSKHKQTEKALRKAQSFREDLISSMQDGFSILDRKGVHIDVNPAFCQMTGFSREELIGVGTPHPYWPPEAYEEIEIAFQKTLRGEFSNFELIFMRKNGERFPVIVSSSWIKDKQGSIISYFATVKDITERKQMEEALRKSEQYFRALFDYAGDAIYVLDMEGNHIVDCNKQASIDLGYSREEIKQLSASDIEDILTPEEIIATHSRLKLEESPIIQSRHRRKDGTTFPVEIRFNLPDRERPEFLIATVCNITERMRAEESLRESESRYRAFFERGPDGIVILDPETTQIIEFNDQACRQLGYSREEFAQLRISDIEVKETAEETKEQIRKVIDKGYDDFETLQRTKQGEIRNVHVTGQIIAILGRPVFHCIWRDITERKKAEEEREKLQTQLSTAVEMARLGHWEYDVAKDLFTFNDHFYKIFHATAEEVGGYTISSAEYTRLFVHPDDMYLVGEEVRKAIKTTDPNFKRQLEHRIIYSDGTVGHISVQFFIVKDAQGKTVKTYGVNQDITERKRIEEELLRTQKLESVGILAGGIAHDFNNILTAIVGNISLAKNQVTPEDEIFDLLNEVEMASTRAQTLTKQLLTFAKGGTPIKETASIKDIIKESVLFALRGSKSNSEFSISEDLWPVEVDVGQFNQIVNNIVINASQAMPLGGTIKVAVENLIIGDSEGLPIKPGRYIGISITDQGIGIAEEHLSHIFDPYFTTKQGGSGLGLATTYSIIKRHDGHIKVESHLRVGTTIHIYLPASEKAIPEKEEVQLIKGQGRILVMDDEDSLRRIVGRILKKLGYESEFAKDGSEAIEMVKKTKEAGKSYDAVILDLTVPGGMGGKECIAKLLEIDPGIKAIVSSGYSEDPVLADFQGYGFKGMIPKPFEARSLSKVLHDVLNIEKE